MWYRNVPAHELDDFLSDDAGRVHRWSLPPGSMPCDSRQDLLEEMRDIFPESVFRAAQAARNFSQQPIYRGVPPTMRRGRVILIGDAAHIAVPHIGAGISLAVRDTTELVRFWNPDNVDAAIAAWAASRRETAALNLKAASELGRSLQFDDNDWDSWTPEQFERWWTNLTEGHRLYFEAGAHTD